MDKALKQRLVGASVLIALAVIVLPMLLSGKPEGVAQQSQKIELPPRPEELNFETRRFALGETPASTVDSSAASEDTISRLPAPAPLPTPSTQTDSQTSAAAQATLPDSSLAAEADIATDTSAANEVVEAVSEPAPNVTGQEPVQNQPQTTEPPKPTPAASATGGRYVVQVASLGSNENAQRLMATLQQKGYAVLLDVVASDVGRLNRVRVGPFERESEATAAVSRIRKEIDGVSPRIVDLQPEQTASVTSPADPLVRWVVQVGSFGEQSNAQNLVKKLRDSGMSAYSETITSGSSPVYRVRVGPFLEREAALGSKQDLQKSMSIDGVVMSVD